MHYKNKRPAKIGDAVIGIGYTIPGILVGVLVGLTAGAETSNARILIIQPKKDGEISGNTIEHIEQLPDMSKRCDAYKPVVEYSECAKLLHADDALDGIQAFVELKKEFDAMSDAYQGQRRQLEEIEAHGGSAPVPAFMRAKLNVSEVVPAGPEVGGMEKVVMVPVCGKPFTPDGDSEDNTFARWTPSGRLELSITNPRLIGKMKVGNQYYADFLACGGVVAEAAPAAVPAQPPTEAQAPATPPAEILAQNGPSEGTAGSPS